MTARVSLAFLLLCSSAAAQGLCDRLRTLTQDPTVAAAHWGISVTHLDGTRVCGIDEAQLFRPASNNKIFTTAAAIALLGPDKQFETAVIGRLDPATGVVTGDLTLVGGGDANLDSNDLPYLPASQRPKTPVPFAFNDLDDLATQLAAKGVKSITGDVIGDDSLFPYEPYPPSWNADDFIWGYGAPVSALTIADNQLKLTITPAKAGAPAVVTLDQHGVAYYTVVNEVRSVAAKSTAGVAVERLPGSRSVRVYGTIAEDAPVETDEIAIDDPAAYAAKAFLVRLAQHRISVAGTTRAKHRPTTNALGYAAALAQSTADANLALFADPVHECLAVERASKLASHASATLLSDVNFTSKVSQNLHAEIMLNQLGERNVCADASNIRGAGIVKAYLLHAGISAADFVLYDGSGLSDHDLVAPRAFTKFLSYAATQPWFAQWKSTLPQGGVDGTLTSRFPTLKGKIFAKTGTLGESRALSGYVTTAAGDTLVFSVLVDDHLPGNADRGVMDKIVTAIADARSEDPVRGRK